MPKTPTVLARHPDPDKQGTRVRKDVYDAVTKALLAVIPKRKSGVAFQDLPRLVAPRVKDLDLPAKGSVSWYVTTLKLDLEARGRIERVPGVRPQHLRRVR